MIQNKVDDSLSLPAAWRNKAPLLIVAGAVFLLASLMISFSSGGIRYFFHSYLANFVYVLSFGIGATFFVLIQHLCRAGWSATIRRQAELISSTIPFLAILFVPILVLVLSGSYDLYEWNRPKADLTGLTAEKTEFLNYWFFSIRSVVYFVVLTLMAMWFYKTSRKQDESGDIQLTLMLQKWAGPMIMAFALTVSFATFDWVMSIDADWYSTILGVYVFAASMFGFFALMITLFMSLQNQGS